MLVSITASGSETSDATELGWLLHKHPDRVRSESVGFGTAHVFYPEATPERCTATLYVEVDPVALSRRPDGRRGGPALEPYVNDRPFVASSMLSSAISKLYRTAMLGVCDTRPELVDQPLELTIEVPAVPALRGGDTIKNLFGPLGYDVDATPLPLDEHDEDWGDSRYVSLRLAITSPLKPVLEHLYVLLPVLDSRKHYWVGEDEIDKLLRRGGEWLAAHPERDFIVRRHLRFGGLAREALARLTDDSADVDDPDERNDGGEAAIEKPISLNEQRMIAVSSAIAAAGAGRVVDLGCGEGRLMRRLMDDPAITKLVGVEVSHAALGRAAARLRLDGLSERRRERVELVHGALTYIDDRIRGFDVAVAVEVIEHIDADRLDAFEEVVFGFAAPRTVIITTPNREYNVHFEGLPEGRMRHGDHRFEWTRAEFAEWADGVCARTGYAVSYAPIGPVDAETGPPTQMAIFTKGGES